MKLKTSRTPIFFVLSLLILPAMAHAHPGHSGHEAGGIGWGLMHPLTGIDHLLFALAIGLWAVLGSGRSRVSIPVSFIIGSIAGMVGGSFLGSFIGMETLLAASLLVPGLALAFGLQMKNRLASLAAGLCAFVHGCAHGSEALTNAPAYFAGILITTVAVAAIGAFVGLVIGRRQNIAIRRIGTVICAAAALLVVCSFS